MARAERSQPERQLEGRAGRLVQSRVVAHTARELTLVLIFQMIRGRSDARRARPTAAPLDVHRVRQGIQRVDGRNR